MKGWGWAAVLAAPAALILLRRPLGALGRFLLRSGIGMAFLWLLRGVGELVGIRLGINLLNGAVLGALGAPGLALLLLVQWVLG